MPYPNEHSARLRDPGDFDPDTYRRTDGSGDGTVQGVKIPTTIAVIWGKLKGKTKPDDPPIAQALRFPTKNWTADKAKSWLSENKVKYIGFEAASGGKEAGEDGAEQEPMIPPYMRCFATQQIKAVNKDRREILHLITTGATDRMGDVVEPGGAFLENFLKNPIVVANHDYHIESVIGKATALEVREDGILARTAFRDTPLADAAFRLTTEGLGGWSIGFRSLEHIVMRDDKGGFKGIRFKKWELLEYSSVVIPANQDVVNSAIQRGLVSPENVPAFFAVQPSTEARPDAKAGRFEMDEKTLGQLGRTLRVQAFEELRGFFDDAVRRIDDAGRN